MTVLPSMASLEQQILHVGARLGVERRCFRRNRG